MNSYSKNSKRRSRARINFSIPSPPPLLDSNVLSGDFPLFPKAWKKEELLTLTAGQIIFHSISPPPPSLPVCFFIFFLLFFCFYPRRKVYPRSRFRLRFLRHIIIRKKCICANPLRFSFFYFLFLRKQNRTFYFYFSRNYFFNFTYREILKTWDHKTLTINIHFVSCVTNAS